MEFVTFELAQKLKEKGFSCKYPFAMYDECGKFHPLYTSADYYKAPSGFEYRCYYDFDDFNDKDTCCPTIEQVLRWLRKEHNLYVCPTQEAYRGNRKKDKSYNLWMFQVKNIANNHLIYPKPLDLHDVYEIYEQAAIAGIEFVIDNLI